MLEKLFFEKEFKYITFVGGETTHLKKNVLVKLDHLRRDRAANEKNETITSVSLGGGCSCCAYDMFDGLLWPKAGKQEWNDKHPDENRSNNNNNNNNNNDNDNNNNNNKNNNNNHNHKEPNWSSIAHSFVTKHTYTPNSHN